MAMDLFLRIDDVEGESQDAAHAGEIDVLAWSFGAASSGAVRPGGGAGVGKVTIQDLSITKHVDSSSPVLLLACCTGKHFRTAQLTVRRSGESPFDFLVIGLSDVLVSSVGTGGSAGEDRLAESIVLSFKKFTYSYTPQQPDGSAGTVETMGWDLARNAKV